MAPKSILRVNTVVIRAGRTKHGPGRKQWGQFEFAQRALVDLFPDGIPPGLGDTRTAQARLVRDVRAWLAKEPSYRARGFPPIGRNTILRSLRAAESANRD